MVERTVTIENATGLHARPAAQFVQAAAKFASKVTLVKDGKEVNAKSILTVLSLGAHKGTTITIRADGADEGDAVAKLVELIESKFGEE